MLTVLEPTTGDKNGQVGCVMTGCVAHTRTNHCDGVVEEAATAFIRHFQPAEKFTALSHDIALKEGEFVDLAAVLTVMAEVVVGEGFSGLRWCIGGTDVVDCSDAREVGLKGNLGELEVQAER